MDVSTKKQRYEGGVYLAQHIPGARLVTFDESAHMPQLEQVELFNRELAEFIDGAHFSGLSPKKSPT